MDKWERRAVKEESRKKRMPKHARELGEVYRRAIEKKVKRSRKEQDDEANS